MILKRTLKFTALVILSFWATITNAQTDAFPQNQGGFEVGAATFAANGWTEVNANNNNWYVGNATFFAGARAAYIDRNQGAGTTNVYTLNNDFIGHFYRDFTIPVGATNVTLTYKWKCAGQAGQDHIKVYVVPTATTPAAQTQLGTGQVSGELSGQGTVWQTGTHILSGVAGATSRLVFTWTNNAAGGTQPPGAIDDVRVFYTPAPGCSGTPNVGNITASANNFCSGGTSTLTLNNATTGTGISYQWKYFDGSVWQNVGTNSLTYTTPALLASTQYQVVTTCNVGGSATSPNFTVTVNPTPVVNVTPTDTFICGVGGSVTITATGNAASYAWSPATGLNTTSGATVIASPPSGKAYTVVGTLGPCTSAAMVSVNVVTPPTLTTTATPATLCSGGSTQLATSQFAGGNYQVYTIAPYTLTPATQTVALDQSITPPQGDLDDGRSGAIPIPFTFNFYGVGYTSIFMGTNGVVGFTGGGFQNGIDAQSVPSATNPDNVIGLFWHDMTMVATGTVTYGTTGSAPNRKFVITYTNVPGYAAPGTNNSGQVILHETTNWVDVIVQSSTSSDFKTIGIENLGATEGLAAPGRNATSWAVPAGAPEAYRFATTNHTYSWTPTANLSNPGIWNPQATNLNSSVTYTVNIQNSVTKCYSTGTAAVTVNPMPTVAISAGTSPICQGGTSTVTFTGTPGATVTYDINGGGAQTVVLDAAGTFVLTTAPLNVTSAFNLQSVTSAENCTATATGTATINVTPRPTAEMVGTQTICEGLPGYIQVNTLVGTGPWSVTFTDNNSNTFNEVINGSTLIEVNPTTTTTYNITALEDANCNAIAGDWSGTATVIVNPRPTGSLSSSVPALCEGDNATLTVTMTGTPPFTFELNDGSVNTPYGGIMTNTFDIVVSPTVATTYSLNFVQDNNCFSIPTGLGTPLTLDYNIRPTATISGDNTICNGDATPLTLTLTGTGPWSVAYNDGTGNTTVPVTTSPSDINVTPSADATYTLFSVSDVNCSAIPAGMTGSAAITVNQLPAITTQPLDVSRCIGDVAVFTAAATGTGITYQWLENGTPLSNNTVYSGVDGLTLTINDLTGLNGNTYSLLVSGTCSPAATSATATLTVNTTNEWTGNVNTLWSEVGNWGCGMLPNEHTDVVIPSPLPNMPDIDIATAICKSLNVSAGANVEFIGVGNALEVKEDIYANGVLDGSLGKVILSGTGAQTIPGVTYGSVDVEGGSTKTFGGNATVTGDLNLTSGYILLFDNNLTLSENATVSNASAASFVVTNGLGVVKKENMGTGGNTATVLFPVGSGTASYTPMSIFNNGTLDNINVRVIDGVWDTYNIETPNGTLQTENAVNKTWFINEDVSGGSDATVTPQWNLLDELPLFAHGNCQVSHYNTTTNEWEESLMTAALGSGPYTQTRTGVTTFSPFGVGSENSPLPLGLVSFKGQLVTEDVKLEWNTVNEFSMNSYDIERSVDNGKKFTTIANEKATGNNQNGTNKYTHIDANVRSLGTDKLLYRLKMNGRNGKQKYSNTVAVHIGSKIKKGMLDAYPNPATDNQLFVRLATGGNETISISVTDMQGKELSSTTYIGGTYKSDAIPVDITQLAQGMYLLRVVGFDNNTIDVLKFNKQ